MSSGDKFLPSRKKNLRTIESAFTDTAFKDQIVQWLYASAYIHDDEELVDLDINLPRDIPFKFTVKKKGGSRQTKNGT